MTEKLSSFGGITKDDEDSNANEVSAPKGKEDQIDASETLVQIRCGRDSDLSFMIQSWLRSHCRSDFARRIPRPHYMANHHGIVVQLMLNSAQSNGQNSATERGIVDCINSGKELKSGGVWVACNPDDPDQIFGYLVGEPRVLHYIYVKAPFRRNGIARKLVARCFGSEMSKNQVQKTKNTEHPAETMAISHHTAMMDLMKMEANYDPYCLFKLGDRALLND